MTRAAARHAARKKMTPKMAAGILKNKDDTRAAPKKDNAAKATNSRAVCLISDALPFGRLWYAEPNAISNAIGYAKFRSRSHDAVIRVFDEFGNVVATEEPEGTFREP
jgi:hypothetical protein